MGKKQGLTRSAASIENKRCKNKRNGRISQTERCGQVIETILSLLVKGIDAFGLLPEIGREQRQFGFDLVIEPIRSTQLASCPNEVKYRFPDVLLVELRLTQIGAQRLSAEQLRSFTQLNQNVSWDIWPEPFEPRELHEKILRFWCHFSQAPPQCKPYHSRVPKPTANRLQAAGRQVSQFQGHWILLPFFQTGLAFG
jgi:hypothetical protein